MGIIKRTGGVFGRNPTFNKIIVEGASEFSASNAPPITVDRLSSDGTIFVMERDGTEIGDINTAGTATNLQIRTTKNSSQLEFHAKNSAGALQSIRWDAATSTNGSLRPNVDAVSNLGLSNRQWNDLYLSGDVILASGSGIDFSATAGTGTSELFDDYEEGIHTATLTPTTSGTIGLAGSANSLSYTKIGNMVNVTGYLYVSAISSPVGAINVSLPFAAADLTDGAAGSAAALFLTNIVSANVSDFVGRVSETSSNLVLYLGSSNNISAASAQQMQIGSQIQLSVTYRTA